MQSYSIENKIYFFTKTILVFDENAYNIFVSDNKEFIWIY